MPFKLEKVPKIDASMGWFPEWAKGGKVINTPKRWMIATQNNLAYTSDVPFRNSRVLVDANPGQIRESPPECRADCVAGGPFAGQPSVDSMTIDEIKAQALRVVNAATDAQDRKRVAFMTGQVNELHLTTHDSPNSIRLSYEIGKLQDAMYHADSQRQFIWTGLDYDGDLIYEALRDGIGNALSLSDLASRTTILNYMRVKASPFGNKAFLPHTVIQAGPNGEDIQVEGACLYLTPQFRAYMTGLEKPGYFAAQCAVGVMLNREATEAIALLKDGNNNFKHTPAQQTLLRSRKVCGFISTIKTQGGDGNARNERTRFNLPNGNFFQGLTFANNCYQQVLGGIVSMLCEERGECIYDFNPTAKVADNAKVLPQHRIESGYQIGEMKPNGDLDNSYPNGTPVYKLVTESTPVVFPETPQGLQDVIADGMNQIAILREWTNNMDVMPYASFRVIGRSDGVADETDFTATYGRYDYTFRHFKMTKKPWGYTCYDPEYGNVGVAAQLYAIPGAVSFILQAKVNGQIMETERIWGNTCSTFTGRIPVNV